MSNQNPPDHKNKMTNFYELKVDTLEKDLENRIPKEDFSNVYSHFITPDCRVGRLFINSQWMQTPTLLLQLPFWPIAIQHSMSNWGYEYLGFSPLFDRIKDGEGFPKYEAIFETINGFEGPVERFKRFKRQ